MSHILVNSPNANSKATSFLETNQINHTCMPGGLNVTAPEAQKHIIGAYVEPNGQGTVVVKWDELNKALEGKEELRATMKLVAFLKIANPYFSDAIANMLMVEAVLRDKDFALPYFCGLYKEFPAQVSKAPVTERNNFKTSKDGTRIVEPEVLQDFVELMAKGVPGGKARIHPSETENVLLIHVEAKKHEDLQKLASHILGEINARFKDYGVEKNPVKEVQKAANEEPTLSLVEQ